MDRDEIRFDMMKQLAMEGDPRDKVVADLGCGENPVSNGINCKKRIRIDFVENPNVDIVCNLSSELPLKENSVDIVFAAEIIEHQTKPKDFLRRIRNAMKQGGLLIITVPNIACIKERIKLLFGKIPTNAAQADHTYSWTENDGHVCDYNIESITRILEETGYKVEKVRTNGIFFHSQTILPEILTPVSFGEQIVIKARKY